MCALVGNAGNVCGVTLTLRKIRSANSALQKSAFSYLLLVQNTRVNECGSNVPHAIVNVIVDRIKFSSPRGVVMSFSEPGMACNFADFSLGISVCWGAKWMWNYSAIRSGVVRLEVKTSAGKAGCRGNSSSLRQAQMKKKSSGRFLRKSDYCQHLKR